MHRILPTLPRDEIHVLRATFLGAVSRYSIAVAFLGIAATVAAAQSSAPAQPGYTIPLIDLANEQDRQVVVDREPGQYLGHPTTVLLEDQQTMLCVYPKGHGRGGIVMKRSTDAGRTWSDRLPTPASWATSMEVPTLHRVVDAEGVKRLIMWSGLHPARLAVSNDDGQTWSELETVGDWGGIVVMGSVVELKTGPGHYMALFHDDGRFIGPNYPHHGEKHFYVYKSVSTDGGLTWGKPEVIATHPEAHLCEPGAIRSPDGNQIAVLLRENSRQFNSFVIYSNDEGATWTEPVQTTGALTGDRHTAKYTPDGRIFVSFRDTTRESSTRGDWVAWVGTYDDIRESREGQYRVRLMDNHRSADCAYPGVEVLPDGTIVTTTYGSWTAGEEPYIVSVRLRLQELDQRVAKRPNVLFILTDDQAPTAVGVENHGELATPHIDRIFQEGVWLKKSFVTTPVCSPSRAALLTSRFGTELGITDWIDPQSEPERGLSPDWVTWPKLFQQAGYRTGLVGKWHLGTQDEFHPTQFGYEYFMGFREGGNTPVDPTLEKEGKTQKFDGYTPDVLTDHAIDFLRQSSEQPFLLSVHYRAPHAAWLPVRDEDWNRYKDLAPTLPDTESAPLDVERVQQMTREYYASIASVDRNVGRLLELLDQLKLADDTIVIFTSDHGYNMGHHGLWYKGNARWVTKTIPPQQWTDIERQSRPNLYDQSMRVPTAIRWPNQLQPGTQIDRVVTHLDWFPTLLAMAGIDRPAGLALRGRDMLPLLKGETPAWDDELYAEYNMKHGATTAMRCVRTPQWKLVKDFANPGRDELYDLMADPDEHHNLVAANLPRVSQAREQLTSQLIRFMEQRQDPAVVLARLQAGDVPAQPAQRWWKGNLHTHSFWSDGNDFPEMIAQWYVDRGYNFLALSDHNVLSQGKHWLPADTIKQRGGEDVIDKYLQRFGRDWVEQRVNSETSNDEVRLKPLSEFRSLVEVRGRFMMVQSEEISDSVTGKPVHMNAANLIEPIPPVGGSTVREAISNNLRAAQEQADRLGQEILVHLNHPNFGYAITAEDLAHVIQEQFFEVFNGHDAINHLGDATHPGDEKIWDIANTIRIGQLHAPPLYGLGTDDSHHYHGRGMSRPGRSWVMVRARHLTPESLILAMRAGEFYASSGVTLDEVRFDETTHTLTVDVAAVPGIGYAIEFIGTPRDALASSAEVTAAAEANPEPDPRIGSVLARVEGEQASYTLSGNELYVRAVVTSTSRHPDPTFENQYQQAWTQPVGWQTQPLQSARE